VVQDFNLEHVEGGGVSQMSRNRAIILVIDQEEGKVVSSCPTSGSQGPRILFLKRLRPIKMIRLFSLTGPSRDGDNYSCVIVGGLTLGIVIYDLNHNQKERV